MDNEIKCACCDLTIAVLCSKCSKYVDMKCVAEMFADKKTKVMVYVCEDCYSDE